MSLYLSIVLIVVSVSNLVFVLVRIRRAKIHISDSVFWILFSALLIVTAAWPDLAIFGARVLGIQTAANFMYLMIIFLLIVKLFLLSMKLSNAEIKIKKLTQKIALDEYKNEEFRNKEEIKKKTTARANKKYLTINK
jgi:hypothetical protein